MKRLHQLALCVIVLLHTYAYGQNNTAMHPQTKVAKPLLFAGLPDRLTVSQQELNKVFTGGLNEQISIQLSGQKQLNAIIVDKNQQSATAVSVNCRLPEYHNALFNISVRLLADNSAVMNGRILHPRYGDVLILVRDNNTYHFEKRSQRLLMPD